jgi:hypothetical protein
MIYLQADECPKPCNYLFHFVLIPEIKLNAVKPVGQFKMESKPKGNRISDVDPCR